MVFRQAEQCSTFHPESIPRLSTTAQLWSGKSAGCPGNHWVKFKEVPLPHFHLSGEDDDDFLRFSHVAVLIRSWMNKDSSSDSITGNVAPLTRQLTLAISNDWHFEIVW